MIFGLLRVKDESRWIERVIRSIQPVCHKILVFDDHSDDDTAAICIRLGCFVYFSEFTAHVMDEGRDKDYLLSRVWNHGGRVGDWCLMVDGDEVLHSPDIFSLLAATKTEMVSCSAHILYLWDREDQVRVDRWYKHMRRPSLFKLISRELSF